MADSKQVLIEVTRPSGYFRNRILHSRGARILVPEVAVPGIVDAKPPYGVVVEDQDAVPRTAAVTQGLDIEATEGARDLAEEAGVDLRVVKGTGEDGRITKGDVRAAIAT